MNPPPRSRVLLAVAGLATVAAVAAGCGGGSSGGSTTGFDTHSVPAVKSDDAARFPRGPSVDYFDPPPKIAPAVKRAAAAAGCTTRGFPMEPVKVQSDGTFHTLGTPTYKVSLPPTSGLHYPVWANWGIYDTPVPFRYQVHDLEHGGIIVHLGTKVPKAGRQAIDTLWAQSPPYMLITPETFKQYTPSAITVTSWQRWMVCKTWTPKVIAAIRAYRNAYRGTGPEQVGAVDADTSGVDLPSDFPTPSVSDKGAEP